MPDTFNLGEIVGRIRFDIPQAELNKVNALQAQASQLSATISGMRGPRGMGGGFSLFGGGGMGSMMPKGSEEITKEYPKIAAFMKAVGPTATVVSGAIAGLYAVGRIAGGGQTASTIADALAQISDAAKDITFSANMPENKKMFADLASNLKNISKEVKEQAATGQEGTLLQDFAKVQQLVLLPQIASTTALVDSLNLAATTDQRIREATGKSVGDLTDFMKNFQNPLEFLVGKLTDFQAMDFGNKGADMGKAFVDIVDAYIREHTVTPSGGALGPSPPPITSYLGPLPPSVGADHPFYSGYSASYSKGPS